MIRANSIIWFHSSPARTNAFYTVSFQADLVWEVKGSTRFWREAVYIKWYQPCKSSGWILMQCSGMKRSKGRYNSSALILQEVLLFQCNGWVAGNVKDCVLWKWKKILKVLKQIWFLGNQEELCVIAVSEKPIWKGTPLRR